MNLVKLVKNRISSEWKEIFNKNVDELNNEKTKRDQESKAVNARIDNLVLKSGGTSPNEVVDARVDVDGNRYNTLQARLLSSESFSNQTFGELKAKNQATQDQLDQLNNTVQNLYGGDGGSVSLYVSDAIGNNTTADGTEAKPFKTIQAAVNSLPLLSTTSFYIYVEPGTYLENVKISNIASARLEIVASNVNTSNAQEGDTGCFVRSISFVDCGMYCRVRGFTQTDVANASGRFLYFTGASYGVADNCRAAVDTKGIDGYQAYAWERCISGNIYGCCVANQFYGISALFGSSMRISTSVSGSGNNIVCRAEGATIFKAFGATITGTTAEYKPYGGQVFTG